MTTVDLSNSYNFSRSTAHIHSKENEMNQVTKKDEDTFQMQVKRNLENSYLDKKERSAAANCVASSALVAYYFLGETDMALSIRPDIGSGLLGSIEIADRDLDQIEENVKSLITGTKKDVAKAEQIVKNEIYFAGAYRMADHIDLLKYGCEEDYLDTWEQNDGCVASPEFDPFGEEDFYFAHDLFELVIKDEDENEYVQHELNILKEFLESNWSLIEEFGYLLQKNITMENEEVLSFLKKQNIKSPNNS